MIRGQARYLSIYGRTAGIPAAEASRFYRTTQDFEAPPASSPDMPQQGGPRDGSL